MPGASSYSWCLKSTANQLRTATRRDLEWIRIFKSPAGFRYKVSIVIQEGKNAPFFPLPSHTHTQVCPYIQNTSTCDCTSPFTSTPLSVPTPPGNISFPNPIGRLEAFTLYCMQTIATYIVVPGFSDDPGRLTGNSGVQRTGGWLCLFGWPHMATAYTAGLVASYPGLLAPASVCRLQY